MYYILKEWTSSGSKYYFYSAPENEMIHNIIMNNVKSVVATTKELNILSKECKVQNIFKDIIQPNILCRVYHSSKDIERYYSGDIINKDSPYFFDNNSQKMYFKTFKASFEEIEFLFEEWKKEYSSKKKRTPKQKEACEKYLKLIDILEKADYKNLLTISNIIK